MPLDDHLGDARLRAALQSPAIPHHDPVPPLPWDETSADADVALEKAACAALHVPHSTEVEADQSHTLYHRLGTFMIRDSEQAVLAACAVHRAHQKATAPARSLPFTYAEYLHAQRNVDSLERHRQRYLADLEGKVPALPDQADVFLKLHSRDRSTPDIAGYLHYLKGLDPTFYAVLSRELPLFVTETARRRHTYLLGTTESGKTELLKTLIHSYVIQPEHAAIVVLDPASDFVREIAHWREFVGEGRSRLVHLKHGLALGMVPTINPFEISGIDPADISAPALLVKRVVAQQIVEAFEQIIAGSMGSAITTPMQALLRPCVLTLLDRPGSTLRDLQRFMSKENNADLVAFGATRSHYQDTAAFFSSSQFSEDRYAPTKGSIYTKLQVLLSFGPFADLTCGKSTVDLERAVNDGKIILFDLGKGSLGTEEAIAFGRLIVALLKGIAFRREHIEDPRKRVPAHVVIDECHNFVTPSIDTILLEARKYRMFLTLCQQNVGYGMNVETRNVVTGMTHTKIAGLTSPDQWERVARLFRLPPEGMEGLGQGYFVAQFGINAPVLRFRSRSDLLGGANSMTPPAWWRLKQRQLRAYYRRPTDPEPTDTPATSHTQARARGGPWGRKRTDFV